MGVIRVVAALALCGGIVSAQSILAVTGWTGTVRAVANQSGSGSTVQALYLNVQENWTHDSTANLTVTLAKDPTNARRWTGRAQGSVSINNKNTMTMTATIAPVTCVGTLFWIGNDPQFSGQATLEADAAGLSYRLWITPNTIPAPNSGSVICPYGGLQFPTVDPNSPFIPTLEAEGTLFPVGGVVTRLTGGLPYLGYTGIGGFVAGPARVTYNVSWDLTATAVAPPDPPEDPDCESGGSIIGCLDQTLGETIAIAGSPYLLRYRSDRATGYQGSVGQATSLGLGGWWLDPIQIYVPGKRTVLAGDGTSTLLPQAPTPDAGGLISIADGSGAVSYIFNNAGRHLRTVDARTGIVELTIDYDAQGRVTKLTDVNGGVTSIERDAGGRPVAIVAPYGQRTALQTDNNGLLSQVQGPSGEVHVLRHETNGLLSGLTNPAGGNWSFRYGPTGRLILDTGASGRTTTLSRQDSGQNFTVSVQKPGGLTTRYESTAITGGRRTSATQPSGAVRTQEATLATSNLAYENGMKVTVTNARDRLPTGAEWAPMALTVKTPAGLEWSAQWNRQAAAGNAPRIDTLKVNGAAITTAYTPSSRMVETTSAAGRKWSAKLNEKGAVVEASAPGGAVYFTSYDQRGKPVSIREQAGERVRTATIEWNSAGLATGLTSASGRKFAWAYDASGRVLQETLPGGRVLAYSYDKLGNVASVTPPGKPAHNFTYNAAGEPLSYAAPGDSGVRVAAYEYDNAGRLAKIANAGAWTIGYSYDAAGRLSQASSGEAQLSYAYDQRTGNLTRLAGPADVGLNYVWDGGLLLSEQWTGPVAGKVEWRYNHDFLPVARRINGGEETALVYDADGLIRGTGPFALKRDDASGRPAAFVLSGAEGWWAYDAAGEYNASAISVLGNEVYSARYERNDAGQIVRKEEWVAGTGTTWEYEYDIGGRLTAANRNGEFYAAYSWDDNDNRISEQRQEGAVTAEFDPGDRLQRSGSATFAWRNSGELIETAGESGSAKYTVDPWGNLLAVEGPLSRVEYVVDGMGRRVGRKVDGVLQQGWVYGDTLRPAAELDGQGQVVREFFYAGAVGPPVAMRRSGRDFLLVADQVGSIRMVIDTQTGEIVQQMDYDPFGRVLQDTNPGFQPFGFAGGLYDPATGLVRMGARDYDASQGRWISQDPRPFTGGSNHYVYCGGDPVNLWDPLGTDPTSRVGQVVQTAESKRISAALEQGKSVVDGAKKAAEFARDPKSVLEAEASKAGPEGARAEYEKLLEANKATAEQSSWDLMKKLEELYKKAKKALCGDETSGDPPSDPNAGKGSGPKQSSGSQDSNPKPVKVNPSSGTSHFVHPIHGPVSGAWK